MDFSAILEHAKSLHRAGDLPSAEALYREVLREHPDQPDTLHFLGMLLFQKGEKEASVDLIERAIDLAPNYADAHNNLGNIHKECGRLDAAEASYRSARAHAPLPDALANLALVLEAQKRVDDALAVRRQLLDEHPGYPKAWLNTGLFLRRNARALEHVDASAHCFRNAIEEDPADSRAYSELGIALHMLGLHDESVAVYQAWLSRDPENPVARHRLASCGGALPPARAADDYISVVFDNFADSFDERLLHDLKYRAPEALVEALTPLLPPAAKALDILDAGCGTGLCGPLIRPWAGRLAGVDLSAGMIEKARMRGGYDSLEVAELTRYLESHPRSYDIILSADTLVYFGALATVTAAAHASLRPGGCLGFTLEAADDEGDVARLTTSGRYCHSRLHVNHAMQDAGFSRFTIEPSVLRTELNAPVHGWVITAERTD